MTETVYRETTIDAETLTALIRFAEAGMNTTASRYHGEPLIARAKSILHRAEEPTRHRTLRDVLDSALDDFKEAIEDYDGDEDSIHEIADSNVPIYTMDLIRLCLDDPDLLTEESDLGPAANPLQAIQWNVYDRINQHLHEYWNEREEDDDTDDDA